jgi:hypothetical protein
MFTLYGTYTYAFMSVCALSSVGELIKVEETSVSWRQITPRIATRN